MINLLELTLIWKDAMEPIEIPVERWGDDLVMRLPAGYANRAGVKEGDILVFDEAPNGTVSLRPTRHFDRAAFLQSLREMQTSMPRTEPVVEEMRKNSRY